MFQHLSEVISGPEQHHWEKPDPGHTFRGRLDGARAKADEVVYQDDDVFAFNRRFIGLGDAATWNNLIVGLVWASVLAVGKGLRTAHSAMRSASS